MGSVLEDLLSAMSYIVIALAVLSSRNGHLHVSGKARERIMVGSPSSCAIRVLSKNHLMSSHTHSFSVPVVPVRDPRSLRRSKNPEENSTGWLSIDMAAG